MPAVTGSTAVLDDLGEEQDRLEAILGRLDHEAWVSPSAAAGWSVADVVLHLAISEEAVVATLAVGGAVGEFDRGGASIDQVMDDMVRAQRAGPDAVFERWRRARRQALRALASADPARAVTWAAAPLRPATLATTRLAEQWAHGLDVTGPLGISFEDTPRLHHVAWLAHRSLPYAFALAGKEAVRVRCVLTGPDAETWIFGPDDAESTIAGPAGGFCRVAARRLPPERSGLEVMGPHGAQALALVRTYAA